MRLDILNDPEIRRKFEIKREKYLVKGDGCWTWSSSSKTDKGYPLQSIGGRKGYSERVSRIMLYLESPPYSEGLYALHHCDNPACVNPSHLYWGTAKQNTQDAIRRGRLKNPPVLTREKTSRCYIKTQEDINKLAQWCEIYSIKEISQKLNKSYDTTAKLLYRLGLKSKVNMRGVGIKPVRKPSAFECPLLENDLIDRAKYMTVTELSRHYRVKRDTIYFQCNRLGISPVKKNKK